MEETHKARLQRSQRSQQNAAAEGTPRSGREVRRRALLGGVWCCPRVRGRRGWRMVMTPPLDLLGPSFSSWSTPTGVRGEAGREGRPLPQASPFESLVPPGAQRGPHHGLEGEGRGWASSLPSRLAAKQGSTALLTFPPSVAASPSTPAALSLWARQGWDILSWQDVPSGTASRGVAPWA